MKNHSRNLHALLCGIFCLNFVCVARCDASFGQNFLQIVMHCDAHLAESLFQTRSKKEGDRKKGLLVTGRTVNEKV